jgi:C4-dicarboxylate transporter
MKKSDTFCNLVLWVIAGAVFATGAVLVESMAEWRTETTSVGQPEVLIALEQR